MSERTLEGGASRVRVASSDDSRVDRIVCAGSPSLSRLFFFASSSSSSSFSSSSSSFLLSHPCQSAAYLVHVVLFFQLVAVLSCQRTAVHMITAALILIN